MQLVGVDMMRTILHLTLVEPYRQMAESAPWTKTVGSFFGALLAIVWGEAMLVLCSLYVATALWDWFLGGQLAHRRSKRALVAGVPAEEYGGYDSEVARNGLLVKVSLLVQIGIVYVGELWVASSVGLSWSDLLPNTVMHFAPEGQVTILSAALLSAAIVNELRSCERNRRYLGGREVPLFSHAMDWLDRMAERFVPSEPPEEPGWHPLPPARSADRLRRRESKDRERTDDD